MFVQIYGNTYDLTNFKHPGGVDILQRFSCYEADLSATVEAYHSTSIKSKLDKYLVKTGTEDTYDYTLYRKFKEEFKKNFPKLGKSAPLAHWLTIGIQLALGIASLFFFSPFLASICSALCFIGLLFNVLHDASHFALFESPKLNFLMSSFSNGFVFWTPFDWEDHHVLRHHSFTGDPEQDPDDINRGFALGLEKLLGKFIHVLKSCNLAYLQIIAYRFTRQLAKNGKIRLLSSYKWIGFVPFFTTMFGGVCGIILIYILRWYYLLHMAVFSIFYWINIVGDHHQAQIDYSNTDIKCWFSRQMMFTGDFFAYDGFSSNLWTAWFGRINYQNVHHVLPKVPSWYYPQIKSFLRDFALKHGLPYYDDQSLIHTLKCFVEKY